MHKLTRLSLLLAAGACLLTLTPAGAYVPPESPIRPVEGTYRPEQSVRPPVCPISDAQPGVRSAPAVVQDTPPGAVQEQPQSYTAVEGAPPGSPMVESPAAPEKQNQEKDEAPQSPEPAPAQPEGETAAARLSILLAGYDLDQGQAGALRVRLGADSALLKQLEQGELTEADLVYLALPNGRTDRLDRYSAWKDEHPESTPEEVVLQVNLDQDRAFYQGIKTVEDPDSLAVLVNKHFALPAGYTPELETLGAGYGSGSLRPEAARAFRAMSDAARAEGISLHSVSAYRSYQRQSSVYNRYLSYDQRESVDTYSARPGHSEHQTGLALDINVASIAAHFERTPAFAWLTEHCAQYGFILRYPQGREDVTGYRFEPWHYRYVGTEAAKACMERQLTYEEYLALQPEKAFQAPTAAIVK